jgi:choline dehydrogenase-like flavoprotein
VEKEHIYDVAIVGGGPAGSTAAALLAKAVRRVIVLERDKFPRFHIGESLLPFSMQTFDRLGLREKLDRTFLPKSLPIKWRMCLFYFFVYAQRFVAFSPRLSLVTKPVGASS